MSNIQDNICKLCDILDKKQYEKLGYTRQLATRIFEELHKYMNRKVNDNKYELDFTSQDLRICAKSIHDTFKRWDDIMNSEKQIKRLYKDMTPTKDGQGRIVDLNKFMSRTLPIMRFRRDYTQSLTELLSLLEYHAVFLYYMEEVNKDEFALKYTERLT